MAKGIALAEHKHLVGFLDDPQEIGHRRDGASRTSRLRSVFEAAPAGENLTTDIDELLHLYGNVEMSGVRYSFEFHPLA